MKRSWIEILKVIPFAAAALLGTINLEANHADAHFFESKCYDATEELVQEFFSSEGFLNAVFHFHYEGETYHVRLVHNPEARTILLGNIHMAFRYGIFPKTRLPDELQESIMDLIPGERGRFYGGGKLNGKLPYDLLKGVTQ